MNPPRKEAGSVERRLAAELPLLRAFAARLVRGSNPPIEADDVVQEAATRALRYRASFDPERALGPWLKKLALRIYLDRRALLLRDEAHREQWARSKSRREDEDEGALERRETLARLSSRLSAREREILLRFHHRGETLREIAAALKLPEGTVKSHLHRARRKLVRDEE